MVERETALADMDGMCREYVSLEVVSVPKSIMLSTTKMQLVFSDMRLPSEKTLQNY